MGALLLCQPLQARPHAAPNHAVVQLANQAHEAYKAGDQKRAAELYFQAHQLDPGDGAFLWGSARSLQLDGQLELAEVRFVAFLQVETADRGLREKAVTYLEQVRAELAQQRHAADAAKRPAVHAEPVMPVALYVAPTPVAVVVVAAPAPPVVVVLPSTPAPPSWSASRHATFWSAAATAVAGAALLAVATWQRSAFETAMAPGFSGGKIEAYPDRAAAIRSGDAIVLRQNVGGAVLAIGTLGALAAWFWPRADANDAVKLRAGRTADGWAIAAEAAW
jgi:hypothetical protein